MPTAALDDHADDRSWRCSSSGTRTRHRDADRPRKTGQVPGTRRRALESRDARRALPIARWAVTDVSRRETVSEAQRRRSAARPAEGGVTAHPTGVLRRRVRAPAQVVVAAPASVGFQAKGTMAMTSPTPLPSPFETWTSHDLLRIEELLTDEERDARDRCGRLETHILPVINDDWERAELPYPSSLGSPTSGWRADPSRATAAR
jgi:hypothetical protein